MQPESKNLPSTQKVTTEQVIEDYVKGGMLQTDIAKKYGVTQRCIAMHLKKAGIKDLESFKKNKANEITDVLRLSLKKEKAWIKSLSEDEAEIKEIPIFTRAAVIRSLNQSSGTKFDKLQLLEGGATENIQVIHQTLTDLQKRIARGKA